MAIQQNPYPLRIDKTTLNKMKVIAAMHGRSVNKEIEQILKDTVSAYEAKYGAIHLPQVPEEDT